MLNKNRFLIIFGIVYLILGILAIVGALRIYGSDQIYWLCYLGVILIGIGMLWKNSYLIATQLNILLIGLAVWSLDFFYLWLTKTPLFGITDYYFALESPLQRLISLQHVYTLPISLYALYLLKLKKTDMWKISFVQVILIFIVTYTLTSPENNINCVFSPCVNFLSPFTLYPLLWFAALFTMILVTNFLLIKLFSANY